MCHICVCVAVCVHFVLQWVLQCVAVCCSALLTLPIAILHLVTGKCVIYVCVL